MHMPLTPLTSRRRFYDRHPFLWRFRHAPERITIGDRTRANPVRTSAVFVVHGIGSQHRGETAARLKAGFEEALENYWREVDRRDGLFPDGQRHPEVREFLESWGPPSPFVRDGFWADYLDLAGTFPEQWESLSGEERSFLTDLWKARITSRSRTFFWFLKMQISLLRPRVLFSSPFSWLVYLPLQAVSLATLLRALIVHPRLLTEYLQDVRLYLEPRGVIERTIVQRIDERVAEAFMQLLGRDTDFRSLDDAEMISVSGDPAVFKRIIWVAHSLGTLISYNVLSDLFTRAAELAERGDGDQQEGVRVFRRALKRFVTLGSPLDKVAFLFGDRVLRFWRTADREHVLDTGEIPRNRPDAGKEWWLNFYHILDPVSGAIMNPAVTGGSPPANMHVRFWKLPGLAHLSYWTDTRVLRQILTRAFGVEFLPDRKIRALPAGLQRLVGLLGMVIWAAILIGLLLTFVALVAGWIHLPPFAEWGRWLGF